MNASTGEFPIGKYLSGAPAAFPPATYPNTPESDVPV